MKTTKKQSKVLVVGMFGMVLTLAMVLTGCESMGDILTGSGAIYSTTSETGLVYSFINNSSYDVNVWDNTGSASIRSGSSVSARFNKNASIYSVSYSPVDKVAVSLSGTTFTFRDK